MRKETIENAAYEVATQVRSVEDSIETALTEIAELQSRIMRVNAVAHTGFGTIQTALHRLASAVTSLVETRGSIAECHAALADAQMKVPGLRTVSFGDQGSCPPKIARVDLRVVA